MNTRDTAGSSHRQQTHFGACVLKSAVQGCGRRLDHSEFQPMAEVSFPELVSPGNAKEKRALLARRRRYTDCMLNYKALEIKDFRTLKKKKKTLLY